MNTTGKDIKNYKDVLLHPEWNDFMSFFNYIGKKPHKDDSIDRIDPAGNYVPGNVRWAGKGIQARNKKVSKDSESGHHGVIRSDNKKKWKVSISINKKPTYIGTYETLEEAIKVRVELEKKYNYYG